MIGKRETFFAEFFKSPNKGLPDVSTYMKYGLRRL
jgi:hypothetical protein